jgi:hypothetical protein
MTYYPNIPFSGESLGQSRPQVQGNFNLIQQTISQDHAAIAATGQGKHNQSTYPSQGAGYGMSKISPATLTNENAIYSATDAFSNVQLFAQKANQSANAGGIQLTRTDTGAAIGANNNTNGYTFLPGGLIMQWGLGTYLAGQADLTITYATPMQNNINFPNYYFGVIATLVGTGFGNIIVDSTVSLLGFIAHREVGSSTNSQSFYWISLGA